MRRINEYLMQEPKVHSAQLNEYLLSKTKTRSLEFPEKPITKQIIKFLEDSGFKDVSFAEDEDFNYDDLIERIVNEAENGDNPVFLVSSLPSYTVIRFAKNGSICKDNPIFLCRANDEGSDKLRHDIDNRRGKSIESQLPYKAFAEKVKNHFCF